jgi:hypothetical protein
MCEKYFEMRWYDNWIQRIENYERRTILSIDKVVKLKLKSKQFQDKVNALVNELNIKDTSKSADEDGSKTI